jgi:hypothetical protein
MQVLRLRGECMTYYGTPADPTARLKSGDLENPLGQVTVVILASNFLEVWVFHQATISGNVLLGADAMESEPNSDFILVQIRRDAPSWKVDFADPAHALTVWAYHPHRMLYCGSAKSLELACEVAAERETQVTSGLYIVDATVNPLGVICLGRDGRSEELSERPGHPEELDKTAASVIRYALLKAFPCSK